MMTPLPYPQNFFNSPSGISCEEIPADAKVCLAVERRGGRWVEAHKFVYDDELQDIEGVIKRLSGEIWAMYGEDARRAIAESYTWVMQEGEAHGL